MNDIIKLIQKEKYQADMYNNDLQMQAYNKGLEKAIEIIEENK